MTSVGIVLDGVRYSLTGLLFGAATGVATEIVADELVNAAQLERSGHSLINLLAEAMVRTTAFSVGAVLSTRLYNELGGRNPDPTDALVFAHVYFYSQHNYYSSIIELGKKLKAEIVGSSAPCCGGCASGSGCAGK